MKDKNLLVISNNFPNFDDTYTGEIFVKEQLKYIKKYFKNVFVISPVAYGIERLRKTKYNNYAYDNVRVYFPKYFNFPLFYNYGRAGWLHLSKKAVFETIKTENINFDLIHAHFTWPSGALAVECKKKYNVPVVITEHTSTTFNRVIDTHEHFSLKTWKLADSIIRVKKGDIFQFGKVGIDLQKVSFIPNGFDSQKFYPMNIEDSKKKLKLPADKKVILYVGNLYGKVKGHKYLVDAAAEIIKKRQDILIFFLGSGNLEDEIEKQIHRLELEDYVKLVGGKPHNEIPLWINACDLFVLPSLNEGNPTVMFEALGCGKPFVGTKVGGVPEIIKSDKYGLLVEPGNSKDLAENILVAMDKEWDKDAILTYAEQYTWENIANEIICVYKNCLM